MALLEEYAAAMHELLSKVVRFIRYRGHYPRPEPITIGGILVGRTHPRFITAELGINHNGSMDIAKRLIEAAAQAGATAVKFQKRTVSEVYTPEELAKPRAVDRALLETAVARGVLSHEAVERLRRSDFKESTNGDLKWALEFTEDEYRELFAYAKEKGILAFATPWDEKSVEFLERLDPPCYKIASASLTDLDLIRKTRATGRPLMMSTGMSTPEEVDRAVEAAGTKDLVLMHTVSTYPSETKDLNLKAINTFRRKYPTVVIGYSGHEKGIAPTLGAAILGAMVIERHITLDKTMFGTDQSASLEPREFAEMVAGIRELEAAYDDDGRKRLVEAEIPIKEKLRRK